MTIEIILDGTAETITEQQLFDLAARGMIGPDTPINVEGKLLPARQVNGLTFAEPPVMAHSVPMQAGPHVENIPRRSNSTLFIILIAILCFVPILVGTLGVLLALLLPAVQAAREAARRMNCSNNLKQIGLALHNFHDANNAFPALYTVDEDGKPLHSWRVLILPYLEQQALFDQIRLDEPWDSPHNRQFHNTFLSVYQCQSGHKIQNIQEGKNCCYAVIGGEGFVPAKQAGDKKGIPLTSITDGLSSTLAVVEVKESFCWMDPTADLTMQDLKEGITQHGRIGSFHTGGCNMVFFDGSCRFISETITPQLLSGIGTIAGGENIVSP